MYSSKLCSNCAPHLVLGVTLLLVLTLSFSFNSAKAATCTFTGNGDGSSWSDGSNWSCGSEPDPSSDDVIIPSGFSVVNDGGNDIEFENGHDITINGSLDMEGKKLQMKHTSSFITVSSTGTLTDVKEMFFTDDSDGLFEAGATISIEHLKTDDNSELTINASCASITDKLENLSDAGIIGTGCINYTGSSSNFTNTGSDGIFTCFSSTLSDCTLDGGPPLPIELASFSAQPIESAISITWSTASEVNNEMFYIERSRDLENWETVGTVPGAGNSSTLLNYSLKDLHPLPGQSYYRLMQKDLDQTTSFSQVESVYFSSDFNLPIKIYPNPTQGQLTVEIADIQTNIRLFNLMGQEVTTSVVIQRNGSNQLMLDLGDVPKGVYSLRLADQSRLIYRQ